jgi:predicted transglutaminase-like cysteine proteinase
MRGMIVAAFCVLLTACAGDSETITIGHNRYISVGPTYAINSGNAFIASGTSSAVQTNGRAINDLKTYGALKRNHPELFSPRPGNQHHGLQQADIINRQVNEMIQFEDDAPNNESWRVLANGGDGDCDDYAVTKLALMIKAGVPRHALRLTVATSKITGQWHLMLAVDVPGRGTYFMDNNNSHLVSAGEARSLYTLWFMENSASQRMELVV